MMMIICIFLSPTGIGSMLGLTVVVVVGAVIETGRRRTTATTTEKMKVDFF